MIRGAFQIVETEVKDYTEWSSRRSRWDFFVIFLFQSRARDDADSARAEGIATALVELLLVLGFQMHM